MPKKNFNTVLLNLKNEPMLQEPVQGSPAATMKSVIVDALLVNDDATGTEKANRFKLAMRLNEGGEQEVTAAEIVLIQKFVGKNYSPLVVGQVFAFLDA